MQRPRFDTEQRPPPRERRKRRGGGTLPRMHMTYTITRRRGAADSRQRDRRSSCDTSRRMPNQAKPITADGLSPDGSDAACEGTEARRPSYARPTRSHDSGTRSHRSVSMSSPPHDPPTCHDAPWSGSASTQPFLRMHPAAEVSERPIRKARHAEWASGAATARCRKPPRQASLAIPASTPTAECPATSRASPPRRRALTGGAGCRRAGTANRAGTPP